MVTTSRPIDWLILHTMQKDNILPLTSRCNTSCIFCSHRYNPKEVQVFGFSDRSEIDVLDSLEYLSPNKKIVIGESATPLLEGEPFVHPNIRSILTALRKKYPNTPLQITTNGILLDQDLCLFLSMLNPVEIYLSLNSIDANNRKILLNDNEALKAVRAAELLGKLGIPFHGSIVAMPHLTGWEDIAKTIIFLATHKAQTIRVFLPGFTHLTPAELRFGDDLLQQLHAFCNDLRKQTTVPILPEPWLVDNFDVQIEGIIPASPAERLGLKIGDTIKNVNGYIPETRVDFFQHTVNKQKLTLKIANDQGEKSIILQKDKADATGIVMPYDFPYATMQRLESILEREKGKNVLSITSEWGSRIIEKVFARIASNKNVQILKVKNNFFGGSISCAGLLTCRDIHAAINRKIQTEGYKPDLVLMPSIAFNPWGKDLTGVSYHSLEEALNIRIEIVD